MTRRIAFIGACGSGKSTLAAKVFTSLKECRVNVELVDEFIRRDIQLYGPMKSIWEQFRTRQSQQELEDAVPAVVHTVIVDSETLTPYFYACLYADHVDARQRLVLQDMHRYLLNDLYMKRYDLIFYLTPIPGADLNDGTRFQSDDEVSILDQHMDLVFNKLFRIGNAHRIDGEVSLRLDKVMSIINASSIV